MSLLKQHSQGVGKTVTIEFEGTVLQVPETTTVAAMILSLGDKKYTRLSPVSGEERAPYCFMGVCHECLVEIDGIRDQQACITQVKEGMKIRRQPGLLGGDE
jgi:predicted molibdopterin-dependent oxidoreductase YjgC